VGVNGSLPAITSAVADALGCNLTRSPLRADRVLREVLKPDEAEGSVG
jgi:CO/xanthine dehydrogenase Mo-binding subunit